MIPLPDGFDDGTGFADDFVHGGFTGIPVRDSRAERMAEQITGLRDAEVPPDLRGEGMPDWLGVHPGAPEWLQYALIAVTYVPLFQHRMPRRVGMDAITSGGRLQRLFRPFASRMPDAMMRAGENG